MSAANGRPSLRLISHTEAQAMFDCQARWDFAYGGRLAGSTLKAKDTATALQAGRAWGAGVAAYHAATGQADALDQGRGAICDSTAKDAERQRELGVYLAAEHEALDALLLVTLDHYAATTEPLTVDRLEHQLITALPSRTGAKRSNRYRLELYLDAVHVDDDGRTWLVEYKRRGQLSSLAQIVLSRQIRWAAWAWRELTGIEPAGVIVDERLAEIPKPPRLVKAKRKSDPQDADGLTPSHAVDQLCTADAYLALCAEYGVEPKDEAVNALRARRWQLREPVVLRPDEIDEAGHQLVSAAKQIGMLDTGELYPVRNSRPQNCGGCPFREICPNPSDGDLIDALFERTVPKRERPLRDEGALEVAA